MSTLRSLLKLHGGDFIACAALQPGLQHFETSFGVISYSATRWGDISLGGPLCAPADRGEMLARFARSRRTPLFYYLQRQDAETLATLDLGLAFSGIGVEREVDAGSLLAAPPPEVRSAARKGRQAGFRLRELTLGQLSPAEHQRLKEINRRYLEAAKTPLEIRFLNRPFDLQSQEFLRVFALEKFDREHQGTFGVVMLNPCHKEGQVAGYLLDLIRFERTRLWGVYLLVVAELCRQLAAEGVSRLSLGYCPLHLVGEDEHLPDRWPFRRQARWMSERFQGVPYLERLRVMKEQLPGEAHQRYMAARSRLPVRLFLAFLEASGLPVGTMAALAAQRLVQPSAGTDR